MGSSSWASEGADACPGISWAGRMFLVETWDVSRWAAGGPSWTVQKLWWNVSPTWGAGLMGRWQRLCDLEIDGEGPEAAPLSLWVPRSGDLRLPRTECSTVLVERPPSPPQNSVPSPWWRVHPASHRIQCPRPGGGSTQPATAEFLALRHCRRERKPWPWGPGVAGSGRQQAEALSLWVRPGGAKAKIPSWF